MDSGIIKPVADRTDIALYAELFFRETGRAAEIGVYEGEFAAHNLKTWTGSYFMIDNWGYRPDGGQDKNTEDEGTWNNIKAAAHARTLFANSRSYVVQGLSVEVAEDLPDNYFDWIYLDASHDYKSVKDDLNAWWPKLRDGGLFSGDDYGKANNERWEKKYGNVAQIYNWNVIDAVYEFCKEKGKQYSVTWMNDRTLTPAWYLIK